MSIEGNATNTESLKALRGTITSIPQVDTTLTKKGHSADAKATGTALNERVKKTDIVDDLNTDEAEKPLSARQGKIIKTQLDEILAILSQ
ncbi:MAG: hypothetical protein E7288_10495 [Lachnospiraceae bacterium]|nr:hypothetical protein [Lachnospiraceae bacterium]